MIERGSNDVLGRLASDSHSFVSCKCFTNLEKKRRIGNGKQHNKNECQRGRLS